MNGWILITILIVIIALAAVFVLLHKYRKHEYFSHETDYKAFFWIGLVWMIVGAPMFLWSENSSMTWLFVMGMVFFVLGLTNRDKWGKKGKISPKEQKWKVISVAAGVILLILGVIAFLLFIR